ncbi:Por secretion system C-terminal sorting domain-containing protein [Flavobacterium fluvii]|uniref:Por secretion system C-terminal sorting domain-containing protein n=1 Tax=Flavobacterium fluvii TaxID=468056 RepID=A0A1M5M567_9FLAO|nr:T9SS type A sorting domain-containing protein [Flavobacterium fluvii]SHG72447.1 Por secretion system C-terminal sorting domain-containing protein [Flavobacterium fluvii]
MKRIITFLILVMGTIGFSQQKETETVDLLTNFSVKLKLDNSSSTATMTIKGPSDRWFAITFGSFSGAMTSGNDLVYYNGSTLIDATHNGEGNTPSDDGVNNWTVTGNTVFSGTRTIIATRPFVAEGSDYTFNFSNSSINLAGSHAVSAINSPLQYHGSNRYNAGSVSLSSLGIDDFSLSATQIYPNPTTGEFVVKTKTFLEKINIYSQTGAFVKTVEVKDNSENVGVNISGLQTGVYLIELVNEKEKSWKKIVVVN